MKKILLGVLMAAALASCSNDETILDRQKDASQINFAVTTQSTTRASEIYCNTNMPGEFYVYATTGGKTFINGDLIQNTAAAGSTATWENQTATRYWPDSSVDFYAQVNGGDNFNWNNGAPTFDNFTVADDVASQTDLLYAVKTAQTKPAAGGDVALNFHHALSQVVFYAKNINPDIYVEVTGVSVCNVKNSGTYKFPTADTDSNVAHGTTTGTASNGAQGSWDLGTTTGSYSVTFPTVALTGAADATAVNLTDNTNTTSDYGHDGTEAAPGTNEFGNAMILMPQADFTGASFTEGAGNIDESNISGVYFKVTCKIYNVATKGAPDTSTDVVLWDGTKDIYIPVSGTWNEGMKYIYTLVFGDGDGGWDPDGPKPVLVPITFTVSVDEFIPVTGSDNDVNMSTK